MNKILFVVYTPFEGFLPKREAELKSRAKLDKVDQVFVTPYNYTTVLEGLVSDTVHLIELHPDNDLESYYILDYFNHLPKVMEMIEKIKAHNI